MREPNLCFPSHNKAAVCITSALYDRRALDCTASLPLVNSLTHLAYLTSTSPRIREILVLDGGLERLVRILSPQYLEPERRNLWKWSLAFQCVVNVGVRGTEQIRTKVVDAGMIPIVLRVLENFLRALELVRQESGRQDNKNNLLPATSSSTQHTDYANHQELLDGLLSHSRNTEQTVLGQLDPTRLQPAAAAAIPSSIVNIAPSSMIPTADDNTNISINTNINTNTQNSISPRQEHRVLRKSTFPYIKMTAAQRRRNRQNRTSRKTVPTWQDPREPSIDNIFYREEDILLSLQLLAYLSKYPHIRNQFHTNYDRNVFSVVERFCHRLHPNPIQYWAGVIMRNACRKDETKGGTRRCANMHCGKWESQPREFAKCRRCRKAKYCCKACQSKAWSDGHRWWCVERHATVPPPPPLQEPTTATATTVDTTAAEMGTMTATAPVITAPTATATATTTTATTTIDPPPAALQNNTQFLEQVQRYQMLQQQIRTVEGISSPTGEPAEQRSENVSNEQPSRGELVARARRIQAFHRLLSTPATTVPTMNGRRLYSSPGQQQQTTTTTTTTQQQQHQQQQEIQEGQQSSPTPSAAILVNDLPLGNTHNNLSELDDSTQTGSTESSGNHASLLMDVGMRMEI